MSKTAKITIESRGKASKGALNQLRRDGFLPGSISQKGGEAISFAVKKDDFRKALNEHGMSGVYTLQAGKKTQYPAMVREIQYAPLTREWLHVTFQLVSMTEETTAEIPVSIKGREDVTYKGLELLQQLETLLLRGLPGDFPSAIELDVSEMEAGGQIVAGDVSLPEGITCETEPDRLILSVSHPRIRVEETGETEEAAAEETAETEPEASES